MARRPRDDDEFLPWVQEQLARVGKVQPRAMFGGHALYLDGVFFAIAWRGALYLRTDETTRERHKVEGMRPFKPYRGQNAMRSYWEVPPAVLRDRRKLASWARDALRAKRSLA